MVVIAKSVAWIEEFSPATTTPLDSGELDVIVVFVREAWLPPITARAAFWP